MSSAARALSPASPDLASSPSSQAPSLIDDPGLSDISSLDGDDYEIINEESDEEDGGVLQTSTNDLTASYWGTDQSMCSHDPSQTEGPSDIDASLSSMRESSSELRGPHVPQCISLDSSVDTAQLGAFRDSVAQAHPSSQYLRSADHFAGRAGSESGSKVGDGEQNDTDTSMQASASSNYVFPDPSSVSGLSTIGLTAPSGKAPISDTTSPTDASQRFDTVRDLPSGQTVLHAGHEPDTAFGTARDLWNTLGSTKGLSAEVVPADRTPLTDKARESHTRIIDWLARPAQSHWTHNGTDLGSIGLEEKRDRKTPPVSDAQSNVWTPRNYLLWCLLATMSLLIAQPWSQSSIVWSRVSDLAAPVPSPASSTGTAPLFVPLASQRAAVSSALVSTSSLCRSSSSKALVAVKKVTDLAIYSSQQAQLSSPTASLNSKAANLLFTGNSAARHGAQFRIQGSPFQSSSEATGSMDLRAGLDWAHWNEKLWSAYFYILPGARKVWAEAQDQWAVWREFLQAMWYGQIVPMAQHLYRRYNEAHYDNIRALAALDKSTRAYFRVAEAETRRYARAADLGARRHAKHVAKHTDAIYSWTLRRTAALYDDVKGRADALLEQSVGGAQGVANRKHLRRAACGAEAIFEEAAAGVRKKKAALHKRMRACERRQKRGGRSGFPKRGRKRT